MLIYFCQNMQVAEMKTLEILNQITYLDETRVPVRIHKTTFLLHSSSPKNLGLLRSHLDKANIKNAKKKIKK